MGKFGFGFDTTAEEVANALESEIAGKTGATSRIVSINNQSMC